LHIAEREWCEDAERMGEIVKSYFEKLFDTMGDLDLYRVLESIPERVTAESNQHLNRLFTVIEVRIALFKIHLTRRPSQMLCPLLFSKTFGILCRTML